MKNMLSQKTGIRAKIMLVFMALVCGLSLAPAAFFPSQALADTTVTCPNNTDYTIKNGLCVPISPFKTGLANADTLGGLISLVLRLLLGAAGVIAVVFIVIGGFRYMTSQGNEEQATKGKNTLVNALIGLVVVILSYTLVTVINSLVTTGNLFG